MTEKKTSDPLSPEFWKNLPVDDFRNPEFWRNFPLEDMKKLLKAGILIPTDSPGAYYLFKEITLPDKPEGILLT